jgi:hypothetical protein
VSSFETRLRVLLRRMPVAGTSALVGMVTLVALTLVILTAIDPASARSASPSASSPAGSAGPRPWVAFLHPQATVPTTTTAPVPVTTIPVPTSTAPTTLTAARATPAPTPATTRPPAPKPPAPPAPTASHGIVPPDNPSANIAESPDFASICRQDGVTSAPCISAATQANDAARAQERLGAMVLPSNFSSLTPGEQLFVLTDIERVDRGLPAVVGMVAQLDTDAQSAAEANTDPTPSSVPPGSTVLRWASNWSEGSGPLGSNYNWMYDDGPGSTNVDCSAATPAACWGHRDNELGFNASTLAASHGILVMGAAEATVPGDSPWTSDAVLLAIVSGNPAYTYTWAQAQAAGAR